MDNQSFETVTATVNQIATVIDTAPDQWREYLVAARQITAHLELTNVIHEHASRQWQIWLIDVLQRFAYSDTDSEGVPDIANWCLRQALTVLELAPGEADLMRLIGQNWLSRAQPNLARIHQLDGFSSSSGSSMGAITSSPSLTRSEDERQAARAMAEAEERLHTADYVVARGLLLPATEYLGRAVDMALARGDQTGSLLTAAAEAYMSLGNVSYARVNERYFREALRYLRLADNVPDYTLPVHLRQ
ncbi:uncharacterized protein BDZ99DRAFT_393927 [Mytilinidion resinicola]|uniref:Uncharacterized protein n=1 Tax=Mytilinidion resinicola TaxID=574789 RepID=A0A6A6YEH0_9PEZI|nr:uncharacterized protein BDZ99DRAFT_393927 [Mytilinidion resinicola]KAF2806923.1 hypothetical protein BDZ99DRAFT_393927 [Mytilinidion resinicola]